MECPSKSGLLVLVNRDLEAGWVLSWAWPPGPWRAFGWKEVCRQGRGWDSGPSQKTETQDGGGKGSPAIPWGPARREAWVLHLISYPPLFREPGAVTVRFVQCWKDGKSFQFLKKCIQLSFFNNNKLLSINAFFFLLWTQILVCSKMLLPRWLIFWKINHLEL